MNIAEFLPREAVLPHLTARTQRDVLAELVAPLEKLHPELQRFDAVRALCEREALGSTALGEGIALPHCKVAGLTNLALAAGVSQPGVPFGPENSPLCHIFFLILAPEKEPGQHLRVLALLARRAKDPVFRSEVLMSKNREQLWQTIIAP